MRIEEDLQFQNDGEDSCLLLSKLMKMLAIAGSENGVMMSSLERDLPAVSGT